MTGDHHGSAAPRLLVEPFPGPGQRILDAYRDLEVAGRLSPNQLAAFGDITDLPRPWDPGSCADHLLRQQLWVWLDAVVHWYNGQLVWDPATIIPACWPSHPHLVHQLAVLADQRHQAGLSLTSDLLEDWHRYTVPGFQERLQHQLREHCSDQHHPWPALGRATRHDNESNRSSRAGRFGEDVAAGPAPWAAPFDT